MVQDEAAGVAASRSPFTARDCSLRLAISAKPAPGVGVRRARSTVVTAQPQRKFPWRDAAALRPGAPTSALRSED